MARADTNLARICGRVVNKYEGKQTTNLTISVMEVTKRGVVFNHPRIYCFREDETGADKFLVGDDVVVYGHIAEPVKRRRNGERYASQAIVGDRVEERKYLFAVLTGREDLKMGPKEQQTNLIYLSGLVQSVSRINNFLSEITVEVFDHGKRNVVSAVSYDKKTLLLNPGDYVTVLGKIITRVKIAENEDEKNKHYQNLQALHIIKEEVPPSVQ